MCLKDLIYMQSIKLAESTLTMALCTLKFTAVHMSTMFIMYVRICWRLLCSHLEIYAAYLICKIHIRYIQHTTESVLESH